MDPILQTYILAFLRDMGLSNAHLNVQSLLGDGSKRLFWRITTESKGNRFIVMANSPGNHVAGRENQAYLMIGKHLYRRGVPVPKIHRFDLERGWFILEDMGKRSLQDAVSSSQDAMSLYECVIENLFRLQIRGAHNFNPEWCFQTKHYDRVVMLQHEADYFRDAFLRRYLGLDKDWRELSRPFQHLARKASMPDSRFFLHRDFQSRNIMVRQGRIGFIDWQGGRLGPLAYDLASLLIDPYTDLSSSFRNRLYQRYLQLIKNHDESLIDSFEAYFPYLALQRNLQILGAFAFLTNVMRKRQFEAYIPTALKSLHALLCQVNDGELSPLKDLAEDLKERKKSVDNRPFDE